MANGLDSYRIVRIEVEAGESTEPMGTKEKFWYRNPEFGLSLVKIARPGTGEDWAEKIAAELCACLGLPHAHCELAAWRGRRGTIGPNMLGDALQLVHGNELLADTVPDYEAHKVELRTPHHTLDSVFASLYDRKIAAPEGWQLHDVITSGSHVFVGYLLLDALIGNTDRHHENWAIIRDNYGNEVLAPTYDHASSLGRNESDEKRRRRLETNDAQYTVDYYAMRAGSNIYPSPADHKPYSCFDAFSTAAKLETEAAVVWLNKLRALDEASIIGVVGRVPARLMSSIATKFAVRMLQSNRDRLLELLDEL